MLRGWKSASCSGFPAFSGEAGRELFEVTGILLAANNIPKLPNQRLRPIPLMSPPVLADRSHVTHISFDFFLYRLLSLVKVG